LPIKYKQYFVSSISCIVKLCSKMVIRDLRNPCCAISDLYSVHVDIFAMQAIIGFTISNSFFCFNRSLNTFNIPHSTNALFPISELLILQRVRRISLSNKGLHSLQ
jgi:hypothetical protein